MSYNNIFNPLTNEFVEVNTSEGLNVLKNYVSYVQNGGSKKTKPKSKYKSKSKSSKSKSKTNADNINKIIKEAEKKEKERKEKQAKEAREIATERLRESEKELKTANPQLSDKNINTILVELWPKLFYEEYNKLQEEYEQSLQRMPELLGNKAGYYNYDNEESDPDQQDLRDTGSYDNTGYLNNGSTEENSDS